MAEYYFDSQYDRNTKKHSVAIVVLDCIMLVISALSFFAMMITLVTSFFDPSVSWILPVVGLISPAIYIGTALLALYWIVRWKWIYATLLMIPVLIAMPSISLYTKIETSKTYGQPSRRGTIKLMSYNIRGLVNDEGQVSANEVAEFIDEQRPDIICFQEWRNRYADGYTEPELFANYYNETRDELAVFSRYKIIDSSEALIHSNFDSGSAFWVDILIDVDTVRLYNIHLHSTAITAEDNEYISNMEFLSDSLSDDIFKGMFKRFRATSIGRAAQADTVAMSISQTPHRVIVCGDFNDTPNSYAYRKISDGLQDAFQKAGTGYSYTFRGFLNLLRIDYVLVEKPTQILHYEVPDSIQFSDHLPIITTLKL